MTQLNCMGMFSCTYADIDSHQEQTEYSHLRLTEVSSKVIRFKHDHSHSKVGWETTF